MEKVVSSIGVLLCLGLPALSSEPFGVSSQENIDSFQIIECQEFETRFAEPGTETCIIPPNPSSVQFEYLLRHNKIGRPCGVSALVIVDNVDITVSDTFGHQIFSEIVSKLEGKYGTPLR